MVEGSIFTLSDLEDEVENEKRKKKSAFINKFEEAEFRSDALVLAANVVGFAGRG
jgi:hypothetical protein